MIPSRLIDAARNGFSSVDSFDAAVRNGETLEPASSAPALPSRECFSCHLGSTLLSYGEANLAQSRQLRESARAFGQILSFLRGKQAEVMNPSGGVIGYRASLGTDDTAYLWDLADQQERKINAVLQPNRQP